MLCLIYCVLRWCNLDLYSKVIVELEPCLIKNQWYIGNYYRYDFKIFLHLKKISLYSFE